MRGFEQRPTQAQGPLPCAPYDRWPDADDNDALLFCRLPGGYFLRFPDRADFTIDTGSGAVTCTPAPDVSDDAVAALYLNQVMPLILNHAGKLVLHAGAINIVGHAVAFAGPSGRGKSTLTAAFAAAGYPFLTDDGLVLEPLRPGYLARPSHASVRLWFDSEAAIFNRLPADECDEQSAKSRLVSGPSLPYQNKPVPLRTIYFLGEGAGGRIDFQPLAPRAGLSKLIQHAFVLDVEDRVRVRAHFGRLAELSETVPLFTLDYPREYAGLRGVIDAVLDHARQGECAS